MITLSQVLLGLALVLQALSLFAATGKSEESEGPLRMDMLMLIGLLLVSSYLCLLQGL